MKKQRKTIEQRALEHWGETLIPQHATYLLISGEMLNGSYEGRQRDIDHREINEFMPCIKKEKSNNYYAGYEYITRFLNRGNIRMNCSNTDFNLELRRIPTYEQWWSLKRLLDEAEELNQNICIELKYNKKSPLVFYDKWEFIEFLRGKLSFCLY